MARTPHRRLTGRHSVWAACAAGVAVTVASLLPVADTAYHSLALHVAVETAATLIALVGAALLAGRFLRAPMRPELVLTGALLLLGMTNLSFSVIPWIVAEQSGPFHIWAPICGRLLGAAGLALGAWLAPEPVWRPRAALSQMLGVVAAALVVTGVGAAVLAPHLPSSARATQVVAIVLYAIAAVGFVRQSEHTASDLATWLSAAATLGAFSRLDYFLFPSSPPEWIYAGDFLRLAFYALVLIGALREVAAYQRELAEVAVHRERRRIARELHDGIAQELAFIASQVRRLTTSRDDIPARIAEAAARALDESRHAIATLARPANASLDASVAQAAEEAAARDDIQIELDLAGGLKRSDAVHDALSRIVREAVGNAVRHGRASVVSVALAGVDGVTLIVEDDGQGLSEPQPNGGGFGLVSMRERAEALGGTVEISPGRERGARLEVWLP